MTESGVAVVMLLIIVCPEVWTIVVVVSSVYRVKYFPRTPPRMSYSGRISSLSLLSRFILPPLLRRDSASADDADSVSTIRMPHDQKLPRFGKPCGEPPLLILRGIGVEHSRCERVAENGTGFFK